jgi:hypothetical protein
MTLANERSAIHDVVVRPLSLTRKDYESTDVPLEQRFKNDTAGVPRQFEFVHTAGLMTLQEFRKVRERLDNDSRNGYTMCPAPPWRLIPPARRLKSVLPRQTPPRPKEIKNASRSCRLTSRRGTTLRHRCPPKLRRRKRRQVQAQAHAAPRRRKVPPAPRTNFEHLSFLLPFCSIPPPPCIQCNLTLALFYKHKQTKTKTKIKAANHNPPLPLSLSQSLTLQGPWKERQ